MSQKIGKVVAWIIVLLVGAVAVTALVKLLLWLLAL